MARRGRTLWERLTGTNLPVVAEEAIHNPLHAKVGATVRVDVLDFRDVLYTLTTIRVLERGTTPMADYELTATDTERLLIRAVPREHTKGQTKAELRLLALTPFFACGWDDDARAEIMQGVNDPAGEFVINPNTPDERKYWRLHGLKSPYTVKVTTLSDTDGDGTIDESEQVTSELELWDFSRLTEDEARQEVTEFLYVQKDQATAWIELLIGREIPPERVNL